MNIVIIDDDYVTAEDEPIEIYGSIVEFYSLLVKKTREYEKERDFQTKHEKERELREIRETLKTLSEISGEISFKRHLK